MGAKGRHTCDRNSVLRKNLEQVLIQDHFFSCHSVVIDNRITTCVDDFLPASTRLTVIDRYTFERRTNMRDVEIAATFPDTGAEKVYFPFTIQEVVLVSDIYVPVGCVKSSISQRATLQAKLVDASVSFPMLILDRIVGMLVTRMIIHSDVVLH